MVSKGENIIMGRFKGSGVQSYNAIYRYSSNQEETKQNGIEDVILELYFQNYI